MNKKTIPKIIHYCWFGKNPLPKEAKKYIESWKKKCPDYEIIEWNENNFDINSNVYAKEAYEVKKWAFVSDYVRLYVLYNYGGIYLDTDVEVLKSFDFFLKYDAFLGFENQKHLTTGIMGCKKGYWLFNEFLSYYSNRHFVQKNGKYDMTPNVITITKICKKYGLVINNKLQNIKKLTIFPNEYFCPSGFETGKINVTNNTVVIHHFFGSWLPNDAQKIRNLQQNLYKKHGKKRGNILFNTLFVPYRLFLKIMIFVKGK